MLRAAFRKELWFLRADDYACQVPFRNEHFTELTYWQSVHQEVSCCRARFYRTPWGHPTCPGPLFIVDSSVTAQFMRENTEWIIKSECVQVSWAWQTPSNIPGITPLHLCISTTWTSKLPGRSFVLILGLSTGLLVLLHSVTQPLTSKYYHYGSHFILCLIWMKLIFNAHKSVYLLNITNYKSFHSFWFVISSQV